MPNLMEVWQWDRRLRFLKGRVLASVANWPSWVWWELCKYCHQSWLCIINLSWTAHRIPEKSNSLLQVAMALSLHSTVPPPPSVYSLMETWWTDHLNIGWCPIPRKWGNTHGKIWDMLSRGSKSRVDFGFHRYMYHFANTLQMVFECINIPMYRCLAGWRVWELGGCRSEVNFASHTSGVIYHGLKDQISSWYLGPWLD